MDVTEAVNEAVVDEAEAMAPRTTLAEIAKQCEHALAQRLTRRLELRQALKGLEGRCHKLLGEKDSREWNEEFGKLVTTANAVFDDLVSQVKVAGNA